MDRVSYHRLARRELNETVQYYESESPGLGSAFLDEAVRCTQAIANFPEAGPLITETIRRRLLLRFPYALLYTIKSDQVRVLAVVGITRSGLSADRDREADRE